MKSDEKSRKLADLTPCSDVGVPAPLLFFDAAPASAAKDGVVGITLIAAKHLPSANGQVALAFATVAHLRCSISSAIELRKAIDRALTLTADQATPSN